MHSHTGIRGNETTHDLLGEGNYNHNSSQESQTVHFPVNGETYSYRSTQEVITQSQLNLQEDSNSRNFKITLGVTHKPVATSSQADKDQI